VTPQVGAKVALYGYCRAFNVNPMDAYNTPAKLILEMLSIHGEAKKIEQEEIEKSVK